MLQTCADALWTAYDLALLDLDGVVYVGSEAVPGAADRLTAAASSGMHLAYVTNNASRTPSSVAEHLRALGVLAAAADVVTSAQAAARLLVDKLPPGAPVFVGKAKEYWTKNHAGMGKDINIKGHNALQSTFVFDA